jgi:hypothetical protein
MTTVCKLLVKQDGSGWIDGTTTPATEFILEADNIEISNKRFVEVPDLPSNESTVEADDLGGGNFFIKITGHIPTNSPYTGAITVAKILSPWSVSDGKSKGIVKCRKVLQLQDSVFTTGISSGDKMNVRVTGFNINRGNDSEDGAFVTYALDLVETSEAF